MGEEEMRRRLEAKGIKPMGKLGRTYGTDKTTPAKKSRDQNKKVNSIRKANMSTLSLAWDQPEENTPTKDIPNQRERTIRSGAAKQVQALARAHKARKEAQILSRKKNALNSQAQEIEAERQKLKNRIIRPKGKNWY